MSQKRYSEEFKQKAMKQVTEDGLSVLTVSKKLGIADVILYAWLKQIGWKSGGDNKTQKDLNTAEKK